jgi:hypothetical protein
VFQLENIIGMVEGLPHQTEPHGVNAREHNSSLHSELASNVTACPSLLSRLLVLVILKIIAQPVLLQYLKTVVDGPRNRNVRGAGWDPQMAGGPTRAVPAGYPARGRSPRLKPMKHHLTLDHVKKEVRDLLSGLQRRDPEALRRWHAIGPLTDMSKPALDHARHIIAREHGFSSWRKLKEHIENLRP